MWSFLFVSVKLLAPLGDNFVTILLTIFCQNAHTHQKYFHTTPTPTPQTKEDDEASTITASNKQKAYRSERKRYKE